MADALHGRQTGPWNWSGRAERLLSVKRWGAKIPLGNLLCPVEEVGAEEGLSVELDADEAFGFPVERNEGADAGRRDGFGPSQPSFTVDDSLRREASEL
jgi:hypothetical protein